MDELLRAVSEDGFVQIIAVSTRELTERARQIHRTLPVATAALGRVLAATAMLGADMKVEEASVTVRINGGGPLGTILCVADSQGNVRGYVQNPMVDLPRRPDGKLDVGAAVGREGLLTVIKDLGLKEPYVGSTALVSGEIAEDFAVYFFESEQTRSAVALGVMVDTDQSVLSAGGYILRLMPGAEDSLLDQLEKNIADTGAVTSRLKDESLEELVRRVLEGFNPRILARQPIEYRCYCDTERVLRAVANVEDQELEDMAAKGEPVEVTCQFCDRVYRFDPRELLEQRRGRPPEAPPEE